jgi:hypothetical protein
VPLLPLFVLLLLPLVLVLALPFSLVQRYRMGKARRMARGWIALINLLLLIFSTALFISSAAFTNFWLPHAFSYSLIGISAGALLGYCGLALTRWEDTAKGLHYTPNRWLVLLVTLAVTARILYGMVRAWEAWGARHETPWMAASGLAGSLGVGAAVIGYYLVYSAGVWRRLSQREQRR